MAEDYYQTLEVARTATLDEIHKAYRDLARRYHPDLNQNDEEAKQKFQAIQRAYEVLKDPKKREMFDRYGPSFESVGGAGAGGSWSARPGADRPGNFTEFDLNDIFGDGEGAAPGGFSDLFRQFGRRSGRQPGTSSAAGGGRGKNIEHELQIPFRTAVSGGSAQISVRRQSGKIETIDVKIPAGIEDGKKIRLRGQGEPGTPRSEPGDILITVRVAPHPHFKRQGHNLIVKVPVTLREAVDGGKVDVPTPKGIVTLTVPPGTSSGKRLRIRGHGVPKANGGGDLFAEIQIVLPESIDEDAKQALRKIEDFSRPAAPRGNLVW